MKLLIQRAKHTTLSVDDKLISEIPFGLVIYVGIEHGDTEKEADYLAAKASKLRIFEDENGKMNRSVIDVGGEVLSVSQFTLCADTSSGNRPSYTNAEAPAIASPLYDYFCTKLAATGIPVKKGIFGADMQILQHNDGPVTIEMDYKA